MRTSYFTWYTLKGTMSTEIARPALRMGRVPVPDPAYATYKGNVAMAARAFRQGKSGRQFTQVAACIPLHAGEPLLATAKGLTDGLVTGGLLLDDSPEHLRAVRFGRCSPREQQWTRVNVWSDWEERPRYEFSVPGVPSPARYSSANSKPRFRGEYVTPDDYRAALEEFIQVSTAGQYSDALRVPAAMLQMKVRVREGGSHDIDNIGLAILDRLEALRSDEPQGLHLDELLGVVEIRVEPHDSMDTAVSFEIHGGNRATSAYPGGSLLLATY